MRRPTRVLVVEPVREVALFYATALTHAGFKVSAFRSAPPAMESLAAFQPDVAVVTCGSEGCDGIEVVQLLRSSSSFSDRPIVLILSPGFDPALLEGIKFQASAASPVGPMRLWSLLADGGVQPTIVD